MFEHIYFIKQVFSPPVSSFNYRIIDPFDLEHGTAADLYDHLDDSYYRYLQNGDFFLNGTALMVPYYPVSREAADKLLYLESFAVLSTRQHYFTQRHSLPSYLLLYTASGTGRLDYDGKTWTLEQGQGFLIDCWRPHRYETVGPAWIHWDLHFIGATAPLLYRAFADHGSAVFRPESETEFAKAIEELLRSYQTFGSSRELFVSNRLENILISLIRNTHHGQEGGETLPKELQELICYMNNNYMKPLTLDDLAGHIGLSKYHFARIFKKHLGFTPLDYLIQLRLHRAKELLESTDIPGNKISCIVGIDNPAYFYRLFKQKFGVTPKEWRNRQSNR